MQVKTNSAPRNREAQEMVGISTGSRQAPAALADPGSDALTIHPPADDTQPRPWLPLSAATGRGNVFKVLAGLASVALFGTGLERLGAARTLAEQSRHALARQSQATMPPLPDFTDGFSPVRMEDTSELDRQDALYVPTREGEDVYGLYFPEAPSTPMQAWAALRSRPVNCSNEFVARNRASYQQYVQTLWAYELNDIDYGIPPFPTLEVSTGFDAASDWSLRYADALDARVDGDVGTCRTAIQERNRHTAESFPNDQSAHAHELQARLETGFTSIAMRTRPASFGPVDVPVPDAMTRQDLGIDFTSEPGSPRAVAAHLHVLAAENLACRNELAIANRAAYMRLAGALAQYEAGSGVPVVQFATGILGQDDEEPFYDPSSDRVLNPDGSEGVPCRIASQQRNAQMLERYRERLSAFRQDVEQTRTEGARLSAELQGAADTAAGLGWTGIVLGAAGGVAVGALCRRERSAYAAVHPSDPATSPVPAASEV